jgi:4'-phosphopantetheinyl transferase
VDIELLRPIDDARDVAARFFSRAEADALDALPGDAVIRGFLSCWTRKEAYVKAVGDGLSMPLDSFSVSVDPENPGVIEPVEVHGDTRRWTVRNVEAPGCVGALVARDPAATGHPQWFEADLPGGPGQPTR